MCVLNLSASRLDKVNMKRHLGLLAVFAVLLAVTPACATDSHDYGTDEYAIIDGGLRAEQTYVAGLACRRRGRRR